MDGSTTNKNTLSPREIAFAVSHRAAVCDLGCMMCDMAADCDKFDGYKCGRDCKEPDGTECFYYHVCEARDS